MKTKKKRVPLRRRTTRDDMKMLNRETCPVLVGGKECKKKTEIVAYDRTSDTLLRTCRDHAELVAMRGGSSHKAQCPGCGCHFGIDCKVLKRKGAKQ